MESGKHFRLRGLNGKGIDAFVRYIEEGCQGTIPHELLEEESMSYSLEEEIYAEARTFDSKYELGCYLAELLKGLDQTKISHERGLWTALALIYFDQICPVEKDGNRKPGKLYRYIYNVENRPVPDWRTYYRHLVRTPFILVCHSGENSKVLLWNSPDKGGEFVEQVASRQDIYCDAKIMSVLFELYYDDDKSKLVRGSTSPGRPGSLRRFIDMVDQFSITYDLHLKSADDIIGLLPSEFESWTSA